MLSRRSALLAAAGLPAALRLTAATAAKEFWDEKFPENWSKDEIARLLNNSPWVQPAAIHFDGGPGGAGGFAGGGYIAPGDRVIYEGAHAEKSPGTFHALARWESAKPMCDANKRTPDGVATFYIVSLTGDFPDELRPRDGEDEAAAEQRIDMLRSTTKLERKGGAPIYLERAKSMLQGELFYFPRLDKITPSNKEVTFSTKLGPLEFKAKFELKDMIYRGKLEL